MVVVSLLPVSSLHYPLGKGLSVLMPRTGVGRRLAAIASFVALYKEHEASFQGSCPVARAAAAAVRARMVQSRAPLSVASITALSIPISDSVELITCFICAPNWHATVLFKRIVSPLCAAGCISINMSPDSNVPA